MENFSKLISRIKSNSMRKYGLLFFTLITICNCANAQWAKIYFDKIVKIAASNDNVAIYNSLDSLKNTRIPSQSRIRLMYSRDLDFGCRHTRILLTLNDIDYQLDILKYRGESVLKVVKTGEGFKGFDPYKYECFETKNENLKSYLSKRNKFYISNKTVPELINEVVSISIFATACGDGLPKTQELIEIEHLVKNNNLYKIENMLKNFSCETQSFGVIGIKLFMKKGNSIPVHTLKIVKHITSRNSDLETCSGCFSGIIAKAF